jgi:flagellin-like protein
MKGISAVIATILMLMITIALASVAYGYISGIFTQQTGVVIQLDATATSCSGTDITVYIRNTGTIAVTLEKIMISGTDSEGGTLGGGGACGLDSVTLAAGGGSVACTTLTGATQGTNTILASGPTNTARGTKYCTG